MDLTVSDVDKVEASTSYFRDCLERCGLMTICTDKNWNIRPRQIGRHVVLVPRPTCSVMRNSLLPLAAESCLKKLNI